MEQLFEQDIGLLVVYKTWPIVKNYVRVKELHKTFLRLPIYVIWADIHYSSLAQTVQPLKFVVEQSETCCISVFLYSTPTLKCVLIFGTVT